MARRQPFAFPLLILLLLSACVPQSPSEGAPSPATPTHLIQTPAPTEDRAITRGEFEVKNTSPDMPEVLVETMSMVFEVQLEPTSPWQTLEATCNFDPAAPVLVRERQSVHYDCQLQEAIPPDVKLRVMVEIRLFGSDQIFRLQVQQ